MTGKPIRLRILAHPRRFRPLVLFLLVAALSTLLGLTVACGESSAEQNASPEVLAAAPAPTVKATTGVLVDRTTGYVLWSKSPNAKRPPASLTKVMTAIIVLQRVKNLDSWCTAPAAVGKDLGNVVGLRPGDRITVRQALYATIVKSANDACITLAYRVAGSEAAFVKLMNAKARSLNLQNTAYKNSRGIPVSGHYMSAADLAKLGRHAMGNPTFRKLCATRSATIKWPGHSVRVSSRNRLLKYDWGYGIKTGSTPQSGKCLLGAGTYGLRPLILVTMNEPTRDQEELDAVAMFAWGDAQYERRTVVTAGDLVTEVQLDGGGEVRAVAASSLTRVVRRDATVKVVLSVPTSLSTVPPAGTKIGTVTYRADGAKIGMVNLIADGR